jgi:hypothetical protein
MNKQQILNITGLTEKEFYSRYPDQESFCNDYPQACAQLAQAAEGIEVTGSLTSPEEIQKLGKAYGFRTDSNKNFQQDMYNYVAKNKPELFKESISKFGPANAGLTNYGSVQGYRPDAYIGPRVADMMGKLGTPQAPRQPQAPKYVEYSKANVRQQYDFNRGMQQKYVGSNVAPTPIPSQPAMPATFPGQQPVSYTQRTAQQPSQQSPAQPFTQNPSGGWNIGPAQAPGQPAMPARQQAPAQGGQPQMSHIGPWHTNAQGEYTRYYTNQQGDMNPGISASAPAASPTVQAYGGEMIKRADGSYSKRGLWDNIRANKGSGKKPTKEMLEQEAKIKAEYAYGGLYAEGGEPNGGMALGQMAAVVDKMSKLRKFVSPDQNLDPWIASKLAVMDHSADAISDYMMYNPEAQGEDMEDMMAYGGMMAAGGEPQNAGFQALPDYVQEKIMSNMAEGGELDMYGKGGYVVKRSSARKGKTHVVIGPDGTKKYFGDSNLGQHPKDPERKKAFYARHKENLANNPYFRAYARATWEEGGEIEDQGGGMFAYGGIHLDPAKKGTFKAQATRMDMSVQEAASHILANKEDYSPAMVKKANFAKNFAKEEGGQINQYKKGGYVGMDGKFHMAKGSGTFSGNAYYADGGEEDPNLTAPYDGSNPNAPLPPFDPNAYQAMQLPTGYVGYSKKDPATGQFVPIENVRKDDLWKHLSGSQKWNTGQTATQKVGRAIGDAGAYLNNAASVAGVISNYKQMNEKNQEMDNYLQSNQTTAGLYGSSAQSAGKGNINVTGTNYGQQWNPQRMGQWSYSGMFTGPQYKPMAEDGLEMKGVDAPILGRPGMDAPLGESALAFSSFAEPVSITPSFTKQQYKQSLVNAYNPVTYNPSGSGDVATKLNNPTNMIYHPWMSKLGAQPSSIKQKDGNGFFARFPDVDTALKAYETQLFGEVDGVFDSRYYKPNTTVDKALRTWSGNGYGGNIYPEIANKTLAQVTPAERRELARRQIKSESGSMYSKLKRKGYFEMGGSYQDGGVVEMTDTEIKQFLEKGGQLEFLD